jgi:drug/metabolite transporter (DMT)-like permease
VTSARTASAALAATTVVWGSTFLVVKDLVAADGAAIPSFLLVGARFVAAALVVLAARFALEGRNLAFPWKRGGILGVLTSVGYAFQTTGLEHTTPSRSAFITNISLLFVPIFGLALGSARPSRALWAGIACALGGLYLLEFPWDAPAPSHGAGMDPHLYGDLLTLGCAAFFAMQILATEAYSPKEPLLSLVFVQFLTCGIFAFGLSLGFERAQPWPDIAKLAPAQLWGLAYLTFAATAACLLVMAWAQRYTSATRAALIFMLEPVFAAIFAFVLAGERFTAAQWIGAALVFVGILFAEMKSKQ